MKKIDDMVVNFFKKLPLKITVLCFVGYFGYAQQTYIYKYATSTLHAENTALVLSFILAFAAEFIATIFLSYMVTEFAKGNYRVSFFQTMLYFLVLLFNYFSSQEGILEKQAEKLGTIPESVYKKGVDSLVSLYQSKLQQASLPYIKNTSNVGELQKRLQYLEGVISATQKETQKCQCPNWTLFQEKQALKQNALEKQRIETENRIDISEAKSVQNQEKLADLDRSFNQELNEKIKELKYDFNGKVSKKNAFVQTEQAKSEFTHLILYALFSMLVVVNAMYSEEGLTSKMELSMQKAKPLQAVKKALTSNATKVKKTPKDFKVNFMDMVEDQFSFIEETDKNIKEILLQDFELDGEEESLRTNIGKWKKELLADANFVKKGIDDLHLKDMTEHLHKGLNVDQIADIYSQYSKVQVRAFLTKHAPAPPDKIKVTI